jgi:folate-binding protein YgfZ
MAQGLENQVDNHGTAQRSRSFFEAAGAVFEDGRVRHFGDTGHEFTALGRAGIVPLLGTTPLRLTGADRLEFLHGQISNEVRRLAPGESRPALMLNVRGHALALMRVYRREDDLFTSVEGGAGARVLEQLQAHIIFDQVEIQDLTDTITTLTLQGEEARNVLNRLFEGELPSTNTFSEFPFASAKVLVSAVARSKTGGFDLHVLTRDVEEFVGALQNAGAELAGERPLEAHRIEAGIADAEHEGGEGVLPQEAGLEYALSYRKGCYLGQEIMARIEARGNLRRRLVRLTLSGWPDTRDVVFGGKTVGRLGGVAEHPVLGVIALGSVRTELTEGANLDIEPMSATLHTLPLEPQSNP